MEHRVHGARSPLQQRGRDISEMEYLKQEAVRVASQKALHEDESRVLAASINERTPCWSIEWTTKPSPAELREKELLLRDVDRCSECDGGDCRRENPYIESANTAGPSSTSKILGVRRIKKIWN